MTNNLDVLTDSSKNHSTSIFLSILLDMNGFSFYISGANDLPDARKQGAYSFDNTEKNLKELAYFLKKKLRIIDHGLKITKVELVYNHHLFALVPQEVFDPKFSKDYLKYTTQTFETDIFKHDVISNTGIVSVFIPLMNIHNLLLKRYGAFEYKHISSYTLTSELNKKVFRSSLGLESHQKNLSLETESDFYTQLSIWCFDSHIVIKGSCNHQLIFYNNFDFLSLIDIVYYVLHVLNDQNIEAQKSVIVLYQSCNEELLQLLQKYITPNVSFTLTSAQIHYQIHQL